MSGGLPIVNLFLHHQHLVDSQFSQVNIHRGLVARYKIIQTICKASEIESCCKHFVSDEVTMFAYNNRQLVNVPNYLWGVYKKISMQST